VTDIRAMTVLPARRTPITLTTEDGLRLIGELALPEHRDPVATLVCLHPLPTHGGMMDSHLLKKAAFRLPALAQLAVMAVTDLSPDQVQQLHSQEEELVKALPLPIKEFQALIAKTCLGKVKPNPTALINAVMQAAGTPAGGERASGSTR